jgi:hypothetical protein
MASESRESPTRRYEKTAGNDLAAVMTIATTVVTAIGPPGRYRPLAAITVPTTWAEKAGLTPAGVR